MTSDENVLITQSYTDTNINNDYDIPIYNKYNNIQPQLTSSGAFNA
jgi:hypothetical protein